MSISVEFVIDGFVNSILEHTKEYKMISSQFFENVPQQLHDAKHDEKKNDATIMAQQIMLNGSITVKKRYVNNKFRKSNSSLKKSTGNIFKGESTKVSHIVVHNLDNNENLVFAAPHLVKA
uniref:Uncharacterized protein n=1 Tax=Romanomermis culicivorax TaxID=13658 RepID=A0A915IS20_ROMCU